MAGEKVEEHSQTEFIEIIKKAYENGSNDHTMTLNKLIEELTVELKRII